MKLLTPVKLGPVSLAHRVVMAPMTRGRCDGERDMLPTATMAAYYAERASGGLIVSEGTATSAQAVGWWRAPCIYTDAHAAAWRPVTDAVHAKGGVMFCQLWHTGRASHSSFRPDAADGRGVAPSAVPMTTHSMGFTPAGKVPHEVPREMTPAEVAAIPGEFAHAARMAKKAGFDGVEVLAASGSLIDQFLQSCVNKRTDEYGGPPENRFRLLRDVVEALLGVFPPHQVAVRLAPNGEFGEMGDPDFRDVFTKYAQWLAPYGLAYLHVVIGLGMGFHNLGPPMTIAEFRKVYPGLIIANCGYTKDSAEKELQTGDCDLVSFGRLFLSTPDLVHRWANGIELNKPADMSLCYSPPPPGKNLGAEGYTGYPHAKDL